MLKYSIVIPTRNGAKYLACAIQSVLDSPRSDFELVVSNNFSTDETARILSEIDDCRLRVISPSLSLPMAGHYEFAISQARGEWISILGDDDAVMPYIFESLDKYIKRYPQVDIISSARAYYFWEGCDDLYGDVVVSYSSNRSARVRSTSKDLYACLKGRRSCFDMPQIYTTGIIRRSLYEDIKVRSGGCFYHSIIPDMYSVVALSLARDKYLRVGEPLFWVGTSNKSMGRSDRIYRDAEHFIGHPAGKHMCVPRSISNDVSHLLHCSSFGPMYIYECLLQCPLSTEEHRASKSRVYVLAAVHNALRKRGKAERDRLLNEIWEDAARHGVSKVRLVFSAYLMLVLSATVWFFSLPSRVARRLGIIQNSVRFFSTNRSRYKTILDASREIAGLRTKACNSRS